MPVLLGGIFQKGCAAGGAAPLMGQLSGANVDPGILDKIPGHFAGDGAGANALLRAGENLLNWLFGHKTSALAAALASSGGIKSASATKLMALVTPFVFAFLKRYIDEKRIDGNSFVSLLTGHEKNLAGCIDNRLASALGFASPSDYLHCRIRPAAAEYRVPEDELAAMVVARPRRTRGSSSVAVHESARCPAQTRCPGPGAG